MEPVVDIKGEEEAAHLTLISGLRVTSRMDNKYCKGVRVFEFYLENKIIKTVFQYKKAKLFAEGLDMGRRLQKEGLL